MTKKDCYYYVGRINQACKYPDLKVILKKMKGLRGLTVYRSVSLNPNEPMLSTFIHEMFHVIYPEWTETKVYKLEAQMMQMLSNRQMISLMGKLVQLLELNKDLNEQDLAN